MDHVISAGQDNLQHCSVDFRTGAFGGYPSVTGVPGGSKAKVRGLVFSSSFILGTFAY